LERLRKQVQSSTKETLLYRGREILDHIEAIVCGCLLMYDATVAPDDVAASIASRWVSSKALGGQVTRFSDPYEKLVLMDRRIFLGDHDLPIQIQGKL